MVSAGMLSGMAGIKLVGSTVDEGEGGLLSPERSLTNMWKFSDGDEDVEVEEAFEDDLEGRMVAGIVRLGTEGWSVKWYEQVDVL